MQKKNHKCQAKPRVAKRGDAFPRALGWATLGVLMVLSFLGQASAQQTTASATTAQGAAMAAAGQVPGTTVPRLVTFNGVISPPMVQNGVGKPGQSSTITMTFSFYAEQEGGTPLWVETQNVQVDAQGRYTVLLGATQAEGLPLDLFITGKAQWLGVQPQLPGEGEQPRVLLVGMPYALKAADADTLGGLPASAYALAGSPTVVAATVAAGSSSSSSASPAAQAATQTGGSATQSTPQALTSCSVTSDGTATANYLAKFTAACNVEKSLLFDTGTSVGLGTNSPGAFLDVQSTITATAPSFNYGLRSLTTANPAATSSAYIFSLFADAQTPTGNTQNISGLYGMDFRTDHYGTGTLSGAYGGFGAVLNHSTGTISNAYGLYTYLSNASTGKISNAYGLYLGAPLNTGGGTFSNYTGVYIANPSGVTGAYGLYSAGGTNYFAGNVGIGTTTPAAVLEVNGTAKFDQAVTFAAGQTFPGTGPGTVTSVGSGLGLTGGPITGSGTLSIDTTKVPLLNAANSFTGNQSVTGNVSATGQLISAVATGTAPLAVNSTTQVPNLNASLLGGLAPSAFATIGPNIFTSTQTISNGNLALPATVSAGTGVIDLGGQPFIQSCCPLSPANTFVGTNAGNFMETGQDNNFQGANTGVGYQALNALTSGVDNTATGSQALAANTTGSQNTAYGQEALATNSTGTNNTATGQRALWQNTTGSFNTATGNAALVANSSGYDNTATGYGALGANFTGYQNTATGFGALGGSATNWGNTATGYLALALDGTVAGTGNAGNYNTAQGWEALQNNTTGVENDASGDLALNANTTGSENTAIGGEAMKGNTTGTGNTAVGDIALPANNGSNNVAVGMTAGIDVRTGNGNTFVGYLTAFSYMSSESNNILIGVNNYGVTGESGVTRLGVDSSQLSGCSPTSSDNGCQVKTFIAAVRGVTTDNNDAIEVMIDSAGQLGTVSSSRRYKEDIHDMAAASDGLLRLRPVTFRYQKPYADGSKPTQYGLIAEEVAEVYPDLVAFDKSGQPETVQYWKLEAMLLNEVQKLARAHAADQKRIAELQERVKKMQSLEERMAAVQARLDRLEGGRETLEAANRGR
jgi:trimeric autotransporter adhesin